MSNETALIIVDMQNDFVQPGEPCCVAGAISTVTSLVSVLDSFRSHHKPVFHITREYRADGSDIENFRAEAFAKGNKCVVPGTEGCQIIKELTPAEGEYRIIKNRFSAFMNTELDLILRRLGILKLIVTGTQYPNCIRATVFDAISLGYDITIVKDATSAETKEIEAANIIDLKNVGVDFISSDQIESLFQA